MVPNRLLLADTTRLANTLCPRTNGLVFEMATLMVPLSVRDETVDCISCN